MLLDRFMATDSHRGFTLQLSRVNGKSTPGISGYCIWRPCLTHLPVARPACQRLTGQRRALLAVGRIVDKLSPGEPGLRRRRLWSLFVSLYALAAVVYAGAVGCEPNLPKTSTLFCVESF